jgi:hypothetical protein
MSTTIMDFRVQEDVAGAVLKQVAALDPAERLREAGALTRILGQAVQELEELWGELREPLERGVVPAEAAVVGRILTRCANLLASSLELVTRDNPAIEEFGRASVARLGRIKSRGASLRRLTEMPAPTPDPERLRRSLQQMDKDEGIDPEALLAELKG